MSASIRALLAAVSDGDWDALLPLSDALEEAGDPRSGRVRATHAIKVDWHLKAEFQWGSRERSIEKLRMAFADYGPVWLTIPNWKIPPEKILPPGIIDGDRERRRMKHRSAQRWFKVILKKMKVPWEYLPSDGSLRIGYPTAHQEQRLAVARRHWDDETGEAATMFEEARA